MSFDMKIKYEGKVIQKAKVDNIDDFDPVMDGLKQKFGSDHKAKRRR